MKHLKIFTSETCSPCKSLKALLKTVELEATVAYFDKDTDPAVFSMHQIRSVPTLIYFVEDQAPRTHVGGITANQLTEFLK